MMKKYIAILFTALALTTSCDDWLDVRGENIQKEKNQFESYHGFRDVIWKWQIQTHMVSV